MLSKIIIRVMFDSRVRVYSTTGVREIRSNVRGNHHVLLVAYMISAYNEQNKCLCVCVCLHLGIWDFSRWSIRKSPTSGRKSPLFLIRVLFLSPLPGHCFIFSSHVVWCPWPTGSARRTGVTHESRKRSDVTKTKLNEKKIPSPSSRLLFPNFQYHILLP
jgi:hypothetical protein